MTQPREHCGELVPSLIGATPAGECVLRPGHSGSHAADNGMRWWLTTPSPAALRDQYAVAISRVLLDSAGRVVPQHIAECAQAVNAVADAVLAVRDRELDRLGGDAQWNSLRHADAQTEIEQLQTRVRHVADQIAAGAPWTASREDTAARIRAAVQPRVYPGEPS